MPVRDVQKDSDGVTLHLTPGVLKLQVCTDRIIHVVYSPSENIPKRTELVVIHSFEAVPFNFKDDAKVVTLATEKMSVRVDRGTGALTFLGAAGNVLLQETADGGKAMTPATVNNEQTFHAEQVFQSPADEHLYGMGEYQDGLWNWRGIPLELRQLNTQCALPMLMSTRGYGLLWDNPSLTDFNPADREIALDPTTRTGSFTAGEAGEYVFFAKDGDRKGEFGIELDGKPLAHLKNMWVTYTLSSKTTLTAGQICSLKVVGGGAAPKLFARPLGNTTTFRSLVGDTIDYYFFAGPQFDDIIAGYRLATGQAPMWPKWAFGFWQCRERYSSQQQILDAIAEFRKRNIPVDLLVQDWQYWGPHGWGSYQWDTAHYPDPATMIKTLHDENIRFMISVWCNPHGDTADDLKKIADGHGFITTTPWIDVFNPAARAVRWKRMNDAFFSIGTDAWWADCTEPGDDGKALVDHQTAIGSGDRYRNAYPLMASQSIYEGQRSATADKRVVNLTRSGFPGLQRYAAATWSGDIAGNWETYRRQIPVGLNYCITGIPYWTTDTGGFFRPSDQFKSEDYNELLTRWFQWSTFCPILRIHGFKTTTEMWNFPLAAKNLEAYDEFRERMIPYTYSLAWRVTHDSDTLMRALPMDFLADPKVYDIKDEYLFGPAFLVAPVLQPRAVTQSVYLPAGTSWVNFWSGKTEPGGRVVETPTPIEQIPLFVRAGSIIPLQPVTQYATEKPGAPIELRIYPGADGDFTLYEDESDNYNYEKGEYATISLHWNVQSRTLAIGARKGNFPGMIDDRTFNVVWVSDAHGTGTGEVAKPDVSVAYTGQSIEVKAP